MKKLINLIILLALPWWNTCLAQEQWMEEVLLQLDTAVARRAETRIATLNNIEQKRKALEDTPGVSPYDIANTMMWSYSDISTDSALHYALCMLENAGDDPAKQQFGKINMCMHMVRRGEYAWAEQQLNLLGEIHEGNKLLYYTTWDMLRTWENEQLAPYNEIRNSRLWSYTDSMNVYKHNGYDKTLAEAQHKIYTNPREATDTLLALAKREGENISWRYIGKRLGLCYQELGIRDSAEYYLALSALVDMREGVVQHTSLHLLSLMLLEDGDIRRAYHYTRAILEDALLSGAKLRMEQVARSMPKVLDAYYQELEARQKRINRVAYMLVGLLLIGSVVLYYTFKINKRLVASRQEQHALNEALRKKELQLNEALEKQTTLVKALSKSNSAKENIVGQYMHQCVNSIQQLEHYRLSLQKVAMQGNMDKLVEAIKRNEFIEEELENFYHGFDETFLQIFPHFVEDLNDLLRCPIVVPEGKLMTIDLRIYALIRLGFTESEDIAKFLHYSTRTIYNYRCRMRNNALCDKDELDQKVRNIGRSDID